MSNPKDHLEQTRKIMQALVRLPPKQHEDMKLGKKKMPVKKAVSKAASAKRKSV